MILSYDSRDELLKKDPVVKCQSRFGSVLLSVLLLAGIVEAVGNYKLV